MLRRHNLLLICLLMASVGPLQAQPVVITVETNWPEALVFADSLRLGPASLKTFTVPASASLFRLVPPAGDAWSVEPVAEVLDAAPGDTITLRIDFPYHYQIESLPFGATVIAETPNERLQLGRTPLRYQTNAPLTGSLVIERTGYVVQQIKPGQAVWNRYVVTLTPAQHPGPETAEVAWTPPRRRRRWLDYTAAGVAVAASVFSIHQKFKADRLFDEYQQTRDPDLRGRIEAYDTRAIVGLGVMQVGVGVLAVRFALR